MLLIQTINTSAQSVISGKMTNNDSSPIVGTTILLLNDIDSTYIAGTISDLNGEFKIINVNLMATQKAIFIQCILLS